MVRMRQKEIIENIDMVIIFYKDYFMSFVPQPSCKPKLCIL